MTTTLEKIADLEIEAAEQLEQLLIDEVNGVDRDPMEARQIMTAAGVSPKDYPGLVEARRQRMADASLVAMAGDVIRDAIRQEQRRDELIAERDAKIEQIRRECAEMLADLETSISNARQLDAKRRQAIKRLIATAPAALVREEAETAAMVRQNQTDIQRKRDQISERRNRVGYLEKYVAGCPKGELRDKAERDLEGAKRLLGEAENSLRYMEETRVELREKMDGIQRRKLIA